MQRFKCLRATVKDVHKVEDGDLRKRVNEFTVVTRNDIYGI